MKKLIILLLLILTTQALSFTVTKEEINQACIDEIFRVAPRYQNKEVSCNVEIKGYESKHLVVSTDNYRVKVVISDTGKISNYFYARVLIYVAGHIKEELRLKFRLHIYEDVLFARDDYQKGARLTKEMFYLKKEDILRSIRDYATVSRNFEEEVFLRANIRADFPLFKWMIKKKPILTFGEQITVTIIQGKITLRMAAKVLQEGYLGDKISVQLIKTKKKFKAEIVEPGKYIITL